MSTQTQFNHSLLKSDLMHRYAFTSSFLDFTPADISLIKACAGALGPMVPTIVDAVYVKLFKYNVTKAFFLPRNEGFEGQTADTLDRLELGHGQVIIIFKSVIAEIKMRKDMLSKYLVKLVTAEYNESFVKYLDWVGKVHTLHSTKKSKINVDYIYINALLGWVEAHFIQIIYGMNLERTVERETIMAFNKLFWIQNDLFAKWHIQDEMTPKNNEADSTKK